MFVVGKDNFAEISKNLINIDLKIILLDLQTITSQNIWINIKNDRMSELFIIMFEILA